MYDGKGYEMLQFQFHLLTVCGCTMQKSQRTQWNPIENFAKCFASVAVKIL